MLACLELKKNKTKQKKKKGIVAIAGWLSGLEHCPVQQKAVGSIPSGHVREATNQCFSH